MRAAGIFAVLALVFVAAFAGSIVLHLNVPPSRRIARTIANRAFVDLFQGTLVVGEIERLSLSGVSIRSADAYDPSGERVIHAEHLRGDADVLAILRSVLLGTGEARIEVPQIELVHADVALRSGDHGVPTIGMAFLPPRLAGPALPGRRRVRIVLDRVQVDHVWAHGDLASPCIDGELTGGVARLEVGSEGLTLDVGPTRTRLRAPLPIDLVGDVTFGLRRMEPELVSRMTLGFEGTLGELALRTTGALAGAHLVARVDVPLATARTIASLLPAPPPRIPLRVPVSALIDVEGDLPALAFRSELAFDGGGSASADGTLDIRAPFAMNLALRLRSLPAQIILGLPATAPISGISGEGHVSIRAGPTLRMDVGLATRPFAVGGVTIPALEARAASSPEGDWSGSADAAEPGMPIHATFTANPRTTDADVTLDATISSLRKLQRVRLPIDGGATLTVTGSLRAGALRVVARGTLSNLRSASAALALASGVLDGRLDGRLDAPSALQVDLTARVRGLHTGFRSWETGTLRAHGAIVAPRLEMLLDAGGGESLSASGTLGASSKEITGVTASLVRREGTTEGRMARLRLRPAGITLEGITVSGGGVGALVADLAVAGGEITGKLRGENLDLEKVARLASYPGRVAGLANVDVDVSATGPGGRKGHLALEFVNVEAASVRGVTGAIVATFDGDRVRADGLARLVARAGAGGRHGPCDGPIAQLRVTGADGRIPGPILDPASWRQATGRVEIAGDDWDLGCIRPLLPAVVGMPDLRGSLTTRFVVERASGARLPTLHSLLVRTRGLVVLASGWSSEHLDAEITGSLDGTTGAAITSVAVIDGGTLATLSLRAALPLSALLDHPDQREELLRRTTLQARLEVPKRAVSAFAGLPTFVTDRLPLLTGLGGDALAGDVELTATMDGSLERPAVAVKLAGHGLAHVTISPGSHSAQPAATRRVVAPALGSCGIPAEITATAGYDGARASLDATVDCAGRVAAHAKADIGVPIADLLAGRARATGSVQVELDQLPVGDIPFFADHDIAGAVTGRVTMAGMGDQPSLNADLHMPGLRVGTVVYERAALTLAIERPSPASKGRSRSKLALELAGAHAGTLTTTMTHEVTWRGGLLPVLDEDHAARLELVAHGFRLAVAQPFIGGLVRRLDGVLDGGAVVGWNAGGPKDASFEKVDLKLRSGVVNVPQLGQELHDVSLAVVGAARGRLDLKGLRAQASNGVVTGAGFADFDGTALRKAELELEIGGSAPLPIAVQGVPVGEVRGSITIGAVAQPTGQLDVKVGLPKLHVDLAPALGRSIQSEDDNPDVTIRTGVAHATQPMALVPGRRISVTLDPVAVTVKGRIFGKVPIDGTIVGSKGAPIRVELGGEHAKFSGTIEVPRFTIDLLHKQFVVENATVKLNPEDVARSLVNATARWDAPDQTTFRVDFVGEATPLTADKLKDKLRCRSASLSQERCLSALVVGPDASAYVGGAVTGQSVATQIIAAEFTTEVGGGVSTTVGTADDGSLRPGLQYRVGPAVVEVSTYGISGTMTPVAGGPAAAATGQHALVTLDWRFWRNWSLRGKVDYSTTQDAVGVDVIWQHAY
jgi:translocation and assembly module TamB